MTNHPRPRIGPIDPNDLGPDQRRVFDTIAGTRGRVAGPFTVLLHTHELADRVQRLGAYLRYEATLDRDVAEAAVLATARVRGSRFEWDAHEPLARRAGLPDAVIETLRSGADTASIPARHRSVIDYVRQLAGSGRVEEDVYQEVLSRLGREGTVELTVLVGYYAMLAMTLAAHELEPTTGGEATEPHGP